MERSTTSLIFKGSISEAIIEAQNQKKLFLVLISGDDQNSTNLENSTLLDERVAEAVSRYCIFLHLIQGRVEASQFSAIYQQKSIPSISAVGYNGLMLWQHEGYINVENFVANIEQAWASMHFQEKDISVESIPLGTANAAVYKEDSEDKDNETPEILHSVTQSMPDFEDRSNENYPKKSFPESAAAIHLSNSGSSEIKPTDAHEGTSFAPNVIMEREYSVKSTTIHLSIRMPSGSNLQEKFSVTDRLRSVKNYVDVNHESCPPLYDLAIPYPRKVFGEEDMNKTLSELEFTGRQALLLIPRLVPSKEVQAARNQSSSNENAIGYFGYLKRALSYVNPLSYLGGNGGSSSHEHARDDDLWEHDSRTGIQSSLSRGETGISRIPYSSNQQNPNAGPSRRTSGAFGSNIHTIRHDEDDFRSNDRNTFWNGNSTQYGGNDKRD